LTNLSSSIRVAAILAAGGLGERFGSDSMPKQFLELGGKPMYAWSLNTLIDHPSVDTVVLVARKDMHNVIQSQLPHLVSSDRRILIANGGKTRQESVHAGLEALKRELNRPSHVLIHDAARPFLEREQLDRFLTALFEHGPCACAMPVSDTIKRTADDVIVETLDRRGLYAMQTPQGAPFDLLLQAHKQAHKDGYDATDDVALLERIQISVKIVLGSAINLKVTNPDDMLIAEALATRKNVLTKERM
jgi:2-C-methyl-D-erythritol 4-phosphate cytidylyltransferase